VRRCHDFVDDGFREVGSRNRIQQTDPSFRACDPVAGRRRIGEPRRFDDRSVKVAAAHENFLFTPVAHDAPHAVLGDKPHQLERPGAVVGIVSNHGPGLADQTLNIGVLHGVDHGLCGAGTEDIPIRWTWTEHAARGVGILQRQPECLFIIERTPYHREDFGTHFEATAGTQQGVHLQAPGPRAGDDLLSCRAAGAENGEDQCLFSARTRIRILYS